jgi:methyl-accepting chemotaxis protein
MPPGCTRLDRETSASAQEISASARELAGNAEVLNQLVAQFKTNTP